MLSSAVGATRRMTDGILHFLAENFAQRDRPKRNCVRFMFGPIGGSVITILFAKKLCNVYRDSVMPEERGGCFAEPAAEFI